VCANLPPIYVRTHDFGLGCVRAAVQIDMSNAAQMKTRLDEIVAELRTLFGHSEIADLKRKVDLRSEHAQLAALHREAERAEQEAATRKAAGIKAAATRKFRANARKYL
jgi:hypothetical protein